jgi:hypothetical protein
MIDARETWCERTQLKKYKFWCDEIFWRQKQGDMA